MVSAHRSVTTRLVTTCLTLLASASFIHAEDSASLDAAKRFEGRITANSVYVRSRASEDAYPTLMLKKDQTVTVVSIKGQWLKIVPPDGSFAYVPKVYTLMRGDGTVGRMKRDCIAHVGSKLNEMASEPMATIHADEDVQIIGQHNEYFEIKPPTDGYVWVNKQFVEPIAPTVAAVPEKKDPTPAPAPDVKVADADLITKTPDSAKPGSATNPEIASARPTTQPGSEAAAADVVVAAPTTKPAFDAVAEYDRLEKQYTDAASQPIMQQPLPELLAGYTKVLESDELPSSMRELAAIRAASLKMRNEAREKFLAVQTQGKKMGEKQQSLIAERTEIEDRIKQNNVEIYAAVGTLRTSSLQVGNATLYRLTDPASGRTVAYVRTNDARFGNFLGQFVGVRGPIVNDPQLKSIVDAPTDIKPVEQSKVNQSIAAQLVPPSLLRTATASVPSSVNFKNNPTPTDVTPKPTDGEARIDKEQPPQ